MSAEVYRWDRGRLRRAIQVVSWAATVLLLLLLAAFLWLEGWLFLKLLLVSLAAGLTVVRVKLMENEKDREAPLRLEAVGLWVKAWGIGILIWDEIEGAEEGPGSWVHVRLQDSDSVLARASWPQRFFMRAFGLIGRGPFAIDCSLLAGTPRQVAASIRRRQAEAGNRPDKA